MAVAEFETSDAKGFMAILSALNAITDEPTINVDYDKISIVQMDPARVAMADFTLPKEMFDEWHVHTPGKACFNLEDVLKEVSRLTKDTRMRVFIDSKDGRMTFTLRDTRKRERLFYLLEVSTAEPVLPKVSFNARFKLLAKEIHEDLKELNEKHCDNVIIQTFDRDLTMIGMRDGPPFTNTYRLSDGTILLNSEVIAESKASYSALWLPNLIRPELCDVVGLEFSTDMPIRISHQSRAIFIYYLAPRLEVE